MTPNQIKEAQDIVTSALYQAAMNDYHIDQLEEENVQVELAGKLRSIQSSVRAWDEATLLEKLKTNGYEFTPVGLMSVVGMRKLHALAYQNFYFPTNNKPWHDRRKERASA